jgi:hypothetical protein
MVLVLAALTGTAFGTGVIVGLARPPGPQPEAREEQPRRPGQTEA